MGWCESEGDPLPGERGLRQRRLGSGLDHDVRRGGQGESRSGGQSDPVQVSRGLTEHRVKVGDARVMREVACVADGEDTDEFDLHVHGVMTPGCLAGWGGHGAAARYDVQV